MADREGLAKRSVTVAGHRTSVSLETPFWEVLGRIARERGCSLAALVAEIDAGRGAGNLSSALRVFVLHEALSLVPRDAQRAADGARETGRGRLA